MYVLTDKNDFKPSSASFINHSWTQLTNVNGWSKAYKKQTGLQVCITIPITLNTAK